jgi:hypothetical protein
MKRSKPLKAKKPMARGKPMKQGGATMKRATRIKPRSAKMQAKYEGDAAAGVEGRRAFVARLLRERPDCEACPVFAPLVQNAAAFERATSKSVSTVHVGGLDAPWRMPPACGGRSVDVHEILARSAGGDILDETNVLAVCRQIHQFIGDAPLLALALGLRRSRYNGRNPAS